MNPTKDRPSAQDELGKVESLLRRINSVCEGQVLYMQKLSQEALKIVMRLRANGNEK